MKINNYNIFSQVKQAMLVLALAIVAQAAHAQTTYTFVHTGRNKLSAYLRALIPFNVGAVKVNLP
jgi:hypothetical protein